MKLLGLLLLGLAVAAFGWTQARRLDRRQRTLEQIAGVLAAMEGQMRYLAPPLEILLDRLRLRPDGAALPFLGEALCRMEAGETACEALTRSIERHTAALALQPEDFRPLALLAGALGQTDLDGQLAAIALCREEIGQQLTQARTDCRTHGLLYRKLGALAGLAVVLLLW